MQHKPRKRFGQNFLHDTYVIERIASAINPKPDDLMVEIGPGQAALTQPLIKNLNHLHVIELDRDLIPIIQARINDPNRITIHNEDAMKFDYNTLAESDRKMRIVGNLPYNISTPLIFHLLSYSEHIDDMYFMLQKELVDRMIAKPDSKDYGRLSIMTQLVCETEKLFNVPPGAFFPPPKVDSAIIKLKVRPSLLCQIDNMKHFSSLVLQAFNMRRKTIRKAMSGLISDEIFEQTGINSKLRPENLSIEQFAILSNAVQ